MLPDLTDLAVKSFVTFFVVIDPIGPTIAEIAARLVGILLVAVAVEYVVVGIHEIWDAGSAQ